MTYIVSSPEYTQHRTGFFHPECPERAQVIRDRLQKEGYLNEENALVPRLATDEELLLCHTKEYVQLVKDEVANCGQGCKMLSTGDVVISSESYDVARLAVGGMLVAVNAVMQNKATNVFCVVRPPGHHACSSVGMGFCLFNNVAIGARYAQTKYGIKRVLIVDFDVHHGNGTQEIFDNDPSVYYFSTHQKGIYPGTGLESDSGKGIAFGTKCNCLIEAGSSSEASVFQAFREKLIPAMEEFKPELVCISCGFDAHEKDPLGGLALKDKDFYELTLLICQIAKKYAHSRVVSVLEGGYNLETIAKASCEHVAALQKMAILG